MDIVLDIQPGQLALVVAPRRLVKDVMSETIACLALRGPVDVIDVGNWFDAYRIARLVRQRTVELTNTLKRIRLARAFTCYQALSLLAQSPANSSPKIVLDPLATFYDENVSIIEAGRLLQESIGHLGRLSRAAPVAAFAQPPSGSPERASFLERLQEIAGEVFIYPPQEIWVPKRLF